MQNETKFHTHSVLKEAAKKKKLQLLFLTFLKPRRVLWWKKALDLLNMSRHKWSKLLEFWRELLWKIVYTLLVKEETLYIKS